jgi:hypothetical protein
MFWSRKRERDTAVETGCATEYDKVEACEKENRFGFLHWKHPCSGVRNAYSTCKVKHHDNVLEKKIIDESLQSRGSPESPSKSPLRRKQLLQIQTRRREQAKTMKPQTKPVLQPRGKVLPGAMFWLTNNVKVDEAALKLKEIQTKRRIEEAKPFNLEDLGNKYGEEEDELIAKLHELSNEESEIYNGESEISNEGYGAALRIQQIRKEMMELRKRLDEIQDEKVLLLQDSTKLMRDEHSRMNALRRKSAHYNPSYHDVYNSNQNSRGYQYKWAKSLPVPGSPEFSARRTENAEKYAAEQFSKNVQRKLKEYDNVRVSHEASLLTNRLKHAKQKAKEEQRRQ